MHVRDLSLVLTIGFFIFPAPAGAAAPAAEPPTVTIGYSWGWTNIGDAAIAPGLLTLLSETFPEHQLQAVANGNRKAERIAENLHRIFPDCHVIDGDHFLEAYEAAYEQACVASNGDPNALIQGDVSFVFDEFTQNCLDDLKKRHPDTYARIADTDVFIYNSGCVLAYGEGTLAGTNFWRYTVRRSLPLLMARRLGTPYGVYSHSFDSFGDDPGYPFFKRLLEDAAFVFCRETDSLRYLLSRNIKPDHVQFVPDSTFSSRSKDEAWARSFMSENALADRRFIAVVIRTPVQKSARPQISDERAEAHMAKIRAVCEAWVKDTGMKVLLCPEVSREIEPAKTQVYDRLDQDTRRHVVWIDSFWTHDQAKALYSRACIVISMELHSMLLSIPEGTPVVHLPFAEVGRKSQFIDDMGLGEYLLDIDRTSAETICGTVRRIYQQRDEVSKLLMESIIPYGRELEQRAMRVIRQVVDSTSQ